MSGPLNQRLRRAALASTLAAGLLAVPVGAAMATAPTPARLLPKPTGITFPQLKKVKGNKSYCLIARSCDRADFVGVNTDPEEGRPDAYFTSQIARYRSAKVAKKVMAKRWKGLVADRHDPDAGLFGGNTSEQQLTSTNVRGYQVITEDGLAVSGPGWRVHGVLVRKGARIVWIQGLQLTWTPDGDLPLLVGRAKASLAKSWNKVLLAKPPKG